MFRARGLAEITQRIDDAAGIQAPRKCHQDGLDACLCLVVALCVAEPTDYLMVGDRQTGYIIVPYGTGLRAELETRCNQTGRAPSEWVRTIRAPREVLSDE